MTTIDIILISFGLAMDALAVSIAVGTTHFLSHKRAQFRIYFHFGLFQALMPIIGWFAGRSIEVYIKSFDHWIAFVLLIFVGGKMIIESFNDERREYRFNPSKGWSLILLSVATSIDALAVGLSLAFIGMDIWFPAFVIGLTTCGLSFVGIMLGNLFGDRFGKRVAFVGGLILCFIGIRIVIDHLII